jgi:hypothetical protein
VPTRPRLANTAKLIISWASADQRGLDAVCRREYDHSVLERWFSAINLTPMLAQQITDLKDHKQLRSLPKFPANKFASGGGSEGLYPVQGLDDRRKPRSLKPGPALPPPGVQTQKNPVPNHPVGQGRGGDPPERLFLPGHWLLGDFRPGSWPLPRSFAFFGLNASLKCKTQRSTIQWM